MRTRWLPIDGKLIYKFEVDARLFAGLQEAVLSKITRGVMVSWREEGFQLVLRWGCVPPLQFSIRS
jgi:hypothetical protein